MPAKAIEVFWQVRHPDEVIILLLFNACAQLANDEALDLVKKVATKIHGSAYSNLRLVTSLLDSLMKCGDMTKARSLFDAAPKKIVPMYGALMAGKS